MRPFVKLGAIAACSALFAGAACAGDIEVTDGWTRATVRGATVAAGYFSVRNTGAAADRLTSASTDVAEKVEVHEMKLDDGVMRMRALPQGVEIKPGATLVLKPGGTHLMLMGLKRALFPGDRLHVKLNFAKAGTVETDLPVEGFGANGPVGEAKKPQ